MGDPGDPRDGWPLLTVETEPNGDSKRTNERGSFLGCFVWLVVPVQEETFILPWLRLRAQYKIFFFLDIHYFKLCVTIGQQPEQAVLQGPLSLYFIKKIL